jgi:hypothetical protein
MKVLLKSKNRSTLVNTLGYDSSRDYTYIRLVNINGCAGEYLHYSLPCVKIHCQRAGMGWRWKVYSHGVGVYRFKWLHSFSFFNFVRWLSCRSSTRGLRKLGYMLESKVDFFWIPSTFFVTYWNLMSKYGNLKFCFLTMCWLGPFFPKSKSPLYHSHLHYFCPPGCESLLKIKHKLYSLQQN